MKTPLIISEDIVNKNFLHVTNQTMKLRGERCISILVKPELGDDLFEEFILTEGNAKLLINHLKQEFQL